MTAGRLVAAFQTYPKLLKYPREQVLLRLKGTPNAAALVTRLFDQDEMAARLHQAGQYVARLAQKRIQLLQNADAHWPSTLGSIPKAHRPLVLYTFGDLNVLTRPIVSLIASPPLDDDVFETAQALARHLISNQITPATGIASGFDVVIHKLANHAAPSLMVASSGLGKIEPKYRPSASACVRSGGLMLSSFTMDHGPFRHDDKERAYLLGGIGKALVFVGPKPDTVSWAVLEWVREAGKPVFGVTSNPTDLPAQVHGLRDEVDFDWVVAAALQTDEDRL